MIAYYLYIFLVLLFSIFDFVKNVTLRKQMFVLLLFSSFLFFGGRYECDFDYENYVQMYNDTPNLGTETWERFFKYYLVMQVEFGFLLSCSVLKALGCPPQSIFLLCSFLTFFFVGKSFWELSKYPFLSFFLFATQFFGQPFMQMRFGGAIAFVLWACCNWFTGKKTCFWLYWLLGVSFHFVALAGLIPCVLSYINWSYKRIYLLFLFAVILLFLPLQGILGWCVSFIGFDRYIGMYFDVASDRYVTIFLLIIVLLPYIIYANRLKKENAYNMCLCMALGSILFAPLANAVSLFSRLYMLLSVSYCLIMPLYFRIIKRDLPNYSFLYVFIALYGLQKFIINLSSMYPYQFRIW